MTKKPLRYFVSGALLAGSMSACGGAVHVANQTPPVDESPPVNEPRPVVNEADHDPAANEHPEHEDPETDPDTNVAPEPEPEPAPEPEMSVNPVAPEE